MWRCPPHLLLFSLLLLGLAAGCTSTKSTNTPRTGTEQLLISNAVDQSLNKVDFGPFADRKVFVEEKYIDCVDKNYVISSVRHRLLRQRAELVAKQEDADIIIEIRSGGVGTDTSDSFIGSPSISLPGFAAIPEIKLITRNSQMGTAKIGIVAYDAKTRMALGEGGTTLARSTDHNWYFLGVGPYQMGSLKKEVTRAGVPTWGQADLPLPTNIVFGEPAPNSVPPLQLTSEASEAPK